MSAEAAAAHAKLSHRVFKPLFQSALEGLIAAREIERFRAGLPDETAQHALRFSPAQDKARAEAAKALLQRAQRLGEPPPALRRRGASRPACRHREYRPERSVRRIGRRREGPDDRRGGDPAGTRQERRFRRKRVSWQEGQRSRQFLSRRHIMSWPGLTRPSRPY